jgi:hypothetical protein
MEIIERRFQTWEPDKDKANRFADVLSGIKHDVAIKDADTNEIVVLQKKIDLASIIDLPNLLRHLRLKGNYTQARTGSMQRASGIKAKEQWFGYIPPDTLKRRYAINRSALYTKNPELGYGLEHLTPVLWNMLKQTLPEQTMNHETVVAESIHRDWWLENCPFTSGIINHTNVLPYHKDRGNLKDSWSMMLALRKGDVGGALHLPEYDETIAVPDCSITFFNGQKYWHGVSPVALQHRDAYRFTLVWYVKDRIKVCLSREEELDRAANSAYKGSRSSNPARTKKK